MRVRKVNPLGVWQFPMFRGHHVPKLRFIPGGDARPVRVLLSLVVDRVERDVRRLVRLHVKSLLVHQRQSSR